MSARYCYIIGLREVSGITSSPNELIYVSKREDNWTTVIHWAHRFTLAQIPNALKGIKRGIPVLLHCRIIPTQEFKPVPNPEDYRWIDRSGRISCYTPPGIAVRQPVPYEKLEIINA